MIAIVLRLFPPIVMNLKTAKRVIAMRVTWQYNALIIYVLDCDYVLRSYLSKQKWHKCQL